jgi:hypothetical protein
MVKRDDITALAKDRVGTVLDAAEAAMPPANYKAFRRLVLKQFGSDGFEADLDRLLRGQASGKDRTG